MRDTKETVQTSMDVAKQYLHSGTEILQSKADEATQGAKDLTNRVVDKLPPPVAGRAEQLMQGVRQRPVPVVAAALGVLLLTRRLLRRNR